MLGPSVGHNVPVKEQGTAMSVPGTELYVVAYHENRDLPVQQRFQDFHKHQFELCIQAFGGLVHQQDVRV